MNGALNGDLWKHAHLGGLSLGIVRDARGPIFDHDDNAWRPAWAVRVWRYAFVVMVTRALLYDIEDWGIFAVSVALIFGLGLLAGVLL